MNRNQTGTLVDIVETIIQEEVEASNTEAFDAGYKQGYDEGYTQAEQDQQESA